MSDIFKLDKELVKQLVRLREGFGLCAVKAEFEAVQVESWFDLVESVMKLKVILPNLPNDKVLELLIKNRSM